MQHHTSFILFSLFFLISLASVAQSQEAAGWWKKPCEQKPVCANNVTYKSKCDAIKNGRLFWTNGECTNVKKCKCPFIYDPVCSKKDTFANSCLAKCADRTDFTKGRCETILPPCMCPKIFKPVCVNGVTFPNECQANCKGFFKGGKYPIVAGECKKPTCTCPQNFNPVCAENGKTYANACLAECDAQKEFKSGECRNSTMPDIPVVSAGVQQEAFTVIVGLFVLINIIFM